MIALCDLDSAVYAAGFASQKNKRLKNEDGSVEIVREVEPLNHALNNAHTIMDSVTSNFKEIKCFLGGKSNWRNSFATVKPYKGNRSAFSKPVYYKEIRQYFIDNYGAVVVDGMEADDAIGIAQTEAPKDTTCIVSIDKDLDGIPGHHYNPKKDISYYINEQDACRNFYKQCLTGDVTDNIPGIHGIGPKTALKLLAPCGGELCMWHVVRREWHRNYPDGYSGFDAVAVAREAAALLWISRHGKERWSEPT